MSFTVCPFCGVAGDAPHDTQEACIAALRAEIARAQDLLARLPLLRRDSTASPEHGAGLGPQPPTRTEN